MTKYADDPRTEQAKKQLGEDKKIVEHSRGEYAERSKGRPTPTQEENDMAMLGAHILEHDDDGSGPDIYNRPFDERRTAEEHTKRLEAERRPQTYQTRRSESSGSTG